MSPIAPGFTCSKLITDTELGCDTPQGADPEQSNASAHVVDMIVSDNVDTSVEEPRNAILHQTDLAALTRSYSTPVHSPVAGCNFELCEQPMQEADSAPPSLLSPQPNAVPILAAAMSPLRNEFTLAKGLPDAQGHTYRDGHQGSHAWRVGVGQASTHKSMPQNPWTKDLDEHLLHLRNVAQLKWGTLVNYFPAMTPNAVKRRYQQLSEEIGTCQDNG